MKRSRFAAKVLDAVGGVAHELFQRRGQAGGVTSQPASEESQHFGEFGCVAGVQPHFGHGFTAFRGWVAWAS